MCRFLLWATSFVARLSHRRAITSNHFIFTARVTLCVTVKSPRISYKVKNTNWAIKFTKTFLNGGIGGDVKFLTSRGSSFPKPLKYLMASTRELWCPFIFYDRQLQNYLPSYCHISGITSGKIDSYHEKYVYNVVVDL